MFKFTLRVATSIFLLTTGTTALFAMESEGQRDDHKKSNHIAPAPISLAPISFEKFTDLPSEIKPLIITWSAFGQCLKDELPVNLALVCTDWFAIIQDQMQEDKDCYKAWYGVFGHEDLYETFKKGAIHYRPDADSIPRNNEGMITLKISELKNNSSKDTSYKLFENNLLEGTSYKLLKENSLEGTFDLSACGDVGKEQVISIGYRKGINPDRKDITEIWIAPQFVIKKKSATTAKHLSEIITLWKGDREPIGTFFTCANEHNAFFDYTFASLAQMSQKNFFYIWRAARGGALKWANKPRPSKPLRHFLLTFSNETR